jgi:hypothetical protein
VYTTKLYARPTFSCRYRKARQCIANGRRGCWGWPYSTTSRYPEIGRNFCVAGENDVAHAIAKYASTRGLLSYLSDGGNFRSCWLRDIVARNDCERLVIHCAGCGADPNRKKLTNHISLFSSSMCLKREVCHAAPTYLSRLASSLYFRSHRLANFEIL